MKGNDTMKTRVYDTFNDRTVSNHRSLDAAVKADRKFQRAIKRSNGQSSYIPTRIDIVADGEWTRADGDEIMEVKHRLDM